VISPRSILLVVIAGLFSLLLASCARDKATVEEPADGPSTLDIKASDIADAVPRNEPLARYGNHSPYEVFGKKYRVLSSSKGYHEKGVASWYGSKFHGRRTSSGEPYDMHLATAAHKSLPLPTYAEVTNLDNGKKVVVKINDRGPFKHGRLIDMSYGAALRLGMTATGTARVDVRVIDVSGEEPAVTTTAYADPVPAVTGGTWLQAGAYGKRSGAEQLAAQLEQAGIKPASIHDVDGLFRVWLGPYESRSDVESVVNRAIELGFERPHTVKR
jgi:rare lipoprotein A